MLHASGLFCLSLSREPAVPRCTDPTVATGDRLWRQRAISPGRASLLAVPLGLGGPVGPVDSVGAYLWRGAFSGAGLGKQGLLFVINIS